MAIVKDKFDEKNQGQVLTMLSWRGVKLDTLESIEVIPYR